MKPSFLLAFRGRLLEAAGLAVVSSPLIVGAGCGGSVTVEQDGAGGSGGDSTAPIVGGTSNGAAGVGGSGNGSTGGNAVGGFGFGGTSFGGAGVGGSPTMAVTACFPVSVNEPCPDETSAEMVFGDCDPNTVQTIVSWIEPVPSASGECCYAVLVDGSFCGKVGRPLRIDGEAEHASRCAGDASWTVRMEDGATPPEEWREAIAEAWERDGLFEHASVAAFAHAALELMAVGAPPDLVADTHRAAIDEVRHAQLCLSLASRFYGSPVSPGPLRGAERISVKGKLEHVAVMTFLEGCVGETLAAAIAQEQYERATDEQARSALATISADEARHAELAWRTVAWCLARGGEPIRQALRHALENDADRYAPSIRAATDPSMEAFGRLTAETAEAVRREAFDLVVKPCAIALIESVDAKPPAVTDEVVASS